MSYSQFFHLHDLLSMGPFIGDYNGSLLGTTMTILGFGAYGLYKTTRRTVLSTVKCPLILTVARIFVAYSPQSSYPVPIRLHVWREHPHLWRFTVIIMRARNTNGLMSCKIVNQ